MRCRGRRIDGRDVVCRQERHHDERSRIGKAAAAVARARGDDAENLAGSRIEHRAAAQTFFDVDVFEFQVEAVIGARTHRARKEHARFLTDDADQFIVLHVTRDRNEVALDHRMRTRRETRGVQAAVVDGKQGQIARSGAVDACRQIVQIAAHVDPNARGTRDDVRGG